jgi:spore maturation protein CgeB
MRILYVGMRHEYGDPSRGLSFEEMNFRSSLAGMGHELTVFDFMGVLAEVGVANMREQLIALAAETRPELAFFFLFTDQLDNATIEAVAREGGCPTVNWFADDHWRFEGFTRRLAPAFDLCITTDADSLPKYAQLANVRVLLSQWACNRYVYRRTTEEIKHEVTFVGQPHGDRRETITKLERAGHPVECWGFGWPAGPIDHEQMVDVFSSSRVNLNLSNSSERFDLKGAVRRLLRRNAPRVRPAQIKGRNFEVPGCGGFLLTERVPHLERYFELDSEVAVYDDVEDLLEKLPRWLEDEERRRAVAEAGYRRILAEHTYDHRFAAIFVELGLSDT